MVVPSEIWWAFTRSLFGSNSLTLGYAPIQKVRRSETPLAVRTRNWCSPSAQSGAILIVALRELVLADSIFSTLIPGPVKTISGASSSRAPFKFSVSSVPRCAPGGVVELSFGDVAFAEVASAAMMLPISSAFIMLSQQFFDDVAVLDDDNRARAGRVEHLV